MTDVWPLAQLQRRGVREFKRRCQAGERTGGGDGTEKLSTAFSEAGEDGRFFLQNAGRKLKSEVCSNPKRIAIKQNAQYTVCVCVLFFWRVTTK